MEEAKVEKEKKRRAIPASEIVWICIEGAMALTGLVLIILGIVCEYLPVLYEDNPLLQCERGIMSATNSNIGFRWLGFFFLLGAAIISLITLNHYSKRTDRDAERDLRRRQRMQVLSESAPAAPLDESKVTEATSTEPEPKKEE